MHLFDKGLYASIKIILLAGFITGTLDILTAFADHYWQSGKGASDVLKFIASGVFGSKAFSGSSSMIWLGLLFHYLIAFAFTIILFILYPKLNLLRINIILLAAIIGIFIWLVMNVIVMPLSNTPKFSFNASHALKAVLILICMIGLPLSLIFKSFFNNKKIIYERRGRKI